MEEQINKIIQAINDFRESFSLKTLKRNTGLYEYGKSLALGSKAELQGNGNFVVTTINYFSEPIRSENVSDMMRRWVFDRQKLNTITSFGNTIIIDTFIDENGINQIFVVVISVYKP